jgi:ribonuclease-3
MADKLTPDYQFRDERLHEQALTHRSHARHNNERLEFLGDALVNMLVAELLYENYPKADEGQLTRLRASLVSGLAMAKIARNMELGPQIRLGPGEMKSGGHRRDSILADALEALVAAVYLDGGWDACRKFVREIYADALVDLADTTKDAKTRLQELLQGRALPLPEYELLNAHGEDHAKQFDVKCSVAVATAQAVASAHSRRAAEQLAASQVLTQVEHWLRNGN